MRTVDTERIARHRDASGADVVGALAGTTGEAHLLGLTDIADGDGALAVSTRVVTPGGTVVADHGGDFVIDTASALASLAGRLELRTASAMRPTVIVFRDEPEMIEAVARGEVGNRAAAREHDGAFGVTALDARAETCGISDISDGFWCRWSGPATSGRRAGIVGFRGRYSTSDGTAILARVTPGSSTNGHAHTCPHATAAAVIEQMLHLRRTCHRGPVRRLLIGF